MSVIKNGVEGRSTINEIRADVAKVATQAQTSQTGNEALTVEAVVAVNSAAQATQKQPKLSAAEQLKQIEAAVSKLKEYADTQKRQLNFSIDEVSEQTVIKVFNASSGELVRQIPSEEALKLAERASQNSSGGLLDFIA